MCNYRGLQDVLAPPKGEASGREKPSDRTLAWSLGLCLPATDFGVNVIRASRGRSMAGCKGASLLGSFRVRVSVRRLSA